MDNADADTPCQGVFDQYSLTPENDTGKSMRSVHADFTSTARLFDCKQDVVLAEHTQSNPAGTVCL
jgi:hypothetical protein